MNVETGAETALFPEKENISGIFIAVQITRWWKNKLLALFSTRMIQNGEQDIQATYITQIVVL
jgi:hypothetical protein